MSHSGKYNWERVLAASVARADEARSRNGLARVLGMPLRTYGEGLLREYSITSLQDIRDMASEVDAAMLEAAETWVLADLMVSDVAEEGEEGREEETEEEIDPIIELVDALPYDPSTDDWLELMEDMQKLLERVDPVYSHRTVRIETDGRPVAVIFTSDFHLGSRWTSYDSFRSLYNWASEQDRLLWAILGDETEGMSPSFYHSRPVLEQLMKPPVQRRLLATLLGKIKDKILFSCMGTSGHGTDKALGEDLVRQIYVQNDIINFIGQGLLTMNVGSQVYEILAAHKLPGTSIHNVNHAQGRALKEVAPFADVIVSAHIHRYGIQEVSHHELAFRSDKLPTNKTFLIQVGTAADGNDPYALSRWQPGVMEFPVLVFMPDEHKVLHVGRKEDLEHYLEKPD